MCMGRVKSFRNCHPNNHTSVKSKGVDFTEIHCVLSVEKVEKG